VPTSFEKDRAREAQHAAREPDKIIMPQTKSALHRTRLPFWDLKVISVLNFYKPHRQPMPLLGLCEEIQTEKVEKNSIVFQFNGSK